MMGFLVNPKQACVPSFNFPILHIFGFFVPKVNSRDNNDSVRFGCGWYSVLLQVLLAPKVDNPFEAPTAFLYQNIVLIDRRMLELSPRQPTM